MNIAAEAQAFQDRKSRDATKGSYFTIDAMEDGGYLLTVFRKGQRPVQTFCPTKAIANRERMRLSDQKLMGVVRWS